MKLREVFGDIEDNSTGKNVYKEVSVLYSAANTTIKSIKNDIIEATDRLKELDYTKECLQHYMNEFEWLDGETGKRINSFLSKTLKMSKDELDKEYSLSSSFHTRYTMLPDEFNYAFSNTMLIAGDKLENLKVVCVDRETFNWMFVNNHTDRTPFPAGNQKAKVYTYNGLAIIVDDLIPSEHRTHEAWFFGDDDEEPYFTFARMVFRL